MNSPVGDMRRVRWGNGLIRFSGTILLISSMVKFLHPAKAVAYMRFFGYMENTLFPIAAMELAIGLLFLRRSTRVPGLMLVSAYMGGAIAAHVAYHPLTSTNPIILFDWNHPVLGMIPPVLVLAAAWLGAWLRHPELFGREEKDVREGELGPVPAALSN